MKITRNLILVISQSIIFLFVLNVFTCNGENAYAFQHDDQDNISIAEFKAIDDTFYFVTNCTDNTFFENLLKNDRIHSYNDIKLCYVFAPADGQLTVSSNGNFLISLPEGYAGTLEFSYSLCSKQENEDISRANVLIIVENDNDCDGIVNTRDLDNDNDGIPDIDEGNGMLDTDSDGFTDNFDIDSDNDGIPDIEEWQKEGTYIHPLETDVNQNGWDDAFDVQVNGNYYKPVDTDIDGVPDYLDKDSDGDSLSDTSEGFDTQHDTENQSLKLNHTDKDRDGLDDVFDIVSCWSLGCNSEGSSAPLPDLNNNGIREWRDHIDIDVDGQLAQSLELLVYPNPSNGIIHIDNSLLDAKGETSMMIYNMQGVVILHKSIVPGSNQIDLHNILPGNYILQLISTSGKLQTKITIQ